MRALASEVRFFLFLALSRLETAAKAVPQQLKPRMSKEFTAPLKPCPSYRESFSAVCWDTRRATPPNGTS